MSRKLHKSSTDKVFAGVCGGFGEYFDIDPVIIRLLWVASVFLFGTGVVLYIIAAIIMPEENETDIEEKRKVRENRVEKEENPERNNKVLGIVFVVAGIFFISKRFFYWLDFGVLAAVALVVFGVYLLIRNRGNSDGE